MRIECHKCHAQYHMDPSLFKGAKGVRVRCRRCGNTLEILNPGEGAPEMNVGNDTSFFRFISASWDPSDVTGIEPAVSLAEKKQSTPPETEWTLPAREPADLSQGNKEEEHPWRSILNEPPRGSANAHAPLMFYPPFPKSPEKARKRQKFRWSFLIVLFFFFLLIVGGFGFLVFSPGGKGILAGIGKDLAYALRFFRS
jgi:predicted Zn finger-like uncharacterized protein